MRIYLAILRQPRVAVLLACAMAVRLSPAMNSLAILLLVQDTSDSFALAGAASGAFAFGSAVGAPLIGRLCDRRGLAVLAPIGIAHAVLLILLAVVGRSSTSVWLLLPLALAAGASYPPTGPALRSRWPVLVPRQHLNAAYALDGVSSSTAFVSGPLFTALLIAIAEPALALPISGIAVAVASAVFVRVVPGGQPLSAPRVPTETTEIGLPPTPPTIAAPPVLATPFDGDRMRLSGPLRWPGFRLLIVSSFAISFLTGTVEVGVAAFADDRDSASLAGVLIGLWSVSTAIAGLAFGAYARRGSLDRTHRIASIAVMATTVPVALAGAPLTLAALLLLSGAAYSPMMVTANRLVERLTPPTQRTEAYTWLLTAFVAGTAGGAAAAGLVVDLVDWRTAVLAGAAVGAAGCVLLVAQRSLLAPEAAIDRSGITGELAAIEP